MYIFYGRIETALFDSCQQNNNRFISSHCVYIIEVVRERVRSLVLLLSSALWIYYSSYVQDSCEE